MTSMITKDIKQIAELLMGVNMSFNDYCVN